MAYRSTVFGVICVRSFQRIPSPDCCRPPHIIIVISITPDIPNKCLASGADLWLNSKATVDVNLPGSVYSILPTVRSSGFQMCFKYRNVYPAQYVGVCTCKCIRGSQQIHLFVSHFCNTVEDIVAVHGHQTTCVSASLQKAG